MSERMNKHTHSHTLSLSLTHTELAPKNCEIQHSETTKNDVEKSEWIKNRLTHLFTEMMIVAI